MRFICFGYLDVEQWSTIPPAEQNAMIDRCFAYDDVLKKNGHWVAGEGLQGPDATVSLSFKNGKAEVTDGPYAETKELLGGLLIIDARDLNQAVQLISKHPGVQMGTWEIRPAQDLTPMIRESEKRRSSARS
jgi:hypothetical protein